MFLIPPRTHGINEIKKSKNKTERHFQSDLFDNSTPRHVFFINLASIHQVSRIKVYLFLCCMMAIGVGHIYDR